MPVIFSDVADERSSLVVVSAVTDRRCGVLLVFDPWRSVILLVAGDKSGQWNSWYPTAIPRAEKLYEEYIAERKKEIEERKQKEMGND